MACARGQSSVFFSKQTSLPLPKPTPWKFHLVTPSLGPQGTVETTGDKHCGLLTVSWGWRRGSEEGIIAGCNVISREDYQLVGEKQNSSPESLQRPKYKFSVNTASDGKENRQVPAQACSGRSGNHRKDHCPQSQRPQGLDPWIRLYWGNLMAAPVLVCPGCHNRNSACGWLTHKKFILSQFWRPVIQGQSPAGPVSGEGSLPGLQTATFLLWPHMALPRCMHTETTL